jgi:hypothetical protein
MRRICLLAVLTMMGSGAALAQSTPVAPMKPIKPKSAHTAGTPIDKGPFTPAANGAYQGGGMVLQGAPGAPAPMPQPTPPGQTPKNMVPQ